MTIDCQAYRARVGLFDPTCPKKPKLSKLITNPTLSQCNNYIKSKVSFIQLLVTLAILDSCRHRQEGKNDNMVLPRLTRVQIKGLLCFLNIYLYLLILLCGDVQCTC